MMSAWMTHPALVLAILGVASGVLGSVFPGPDLAAAGLPKIQAVFAGLWFGLIAGYAAWRWSGHFVAAVLSAVPATWIGWEIAVNLAMSISQGWLQPTGTPENIRHLAGGFVAGAAGAATMLGGMALFCRELRRISVWSWVVVTGALFGLLLPVAMRADAFSLLLVPWQAAVAGVIGYHLSLAMGSTSRT